MDPGVFFEDLLSDQPGLAHTGESIAQTVQLVCDVLTVVLLVLAERMREFCTSAMPNPDTVH